MRRARFAKYPNRAKVPRVVRTPTTLATYFIWCQKRSLAMTASLTVLADRLRSVDADTPAYPSRMRARRKSYEKGAGPGACAHAAGTSACLPEGLHSRGGHVMVSAVTATLTWTLLGASLIVGLAAIVFLADLVRRLRSRRRGEGEVALLPDPPKVPAWLRAVTQIVSLAYFVLL